MKEALIFSNNFFEVEVRLFRSVPQDAYKGVILEYLLDTLSEVGHRPGVADLMRYIGESLILIYKPEIFPVRRLR